MGHIGLLTKPSNLIGGLDGIVWLSLPKSLVDLGMMS